MSYVKQCNAVIAAYGDREGRGPLTGVMCVLKPDFEIINALEALCFLTCFGLALPLAGRGLGWDGGSRGVG